VINKIDLPAARPDYVKEQIENVLAIPADDALPISAKSGLGVADVLEAIVKHVPPPKGSFEAPLRALIFDSWFDIYRGAVVLVRVMEGRIAPRMKIRLCAATKSTKWKRSARSRPSPSCSTSWPPATWASSSPTSSAWPTRAWATRC
jgi:GTP-binding protein LepA